MVMKTNRISFKDKIKGKQISFAEYAWMEVPGSYTCVGEEEDTKDACYQHMVQSGSVTCWVSRPYVSYTKFYVIKKHQNLNLHPCINI